MTLILASTSRYRQRLLERLQIPFECRPPGIGECVVAGEAPPARARRLARDKARAVAARHPGATVIGSDQVAALGQSVLDKPGDYARASAQLHACSGKSVVFYTGLTLIHHGIEHSHTEPFEVVFRTLTADEIDNYLRADQPFDCAGSFKWESLGIALFERLRGDDPTSLEGLPLIALTRLLRATGYRVI